MGDYFIVIESYDGASTAQNTLKTDNITLKVVEEPIIIEPEVFIEDPIILPSFAEELEQ